MENNNSNFSNFSEPTDSNFTTPPKNYLVHAIIVTLLCCLPLGIVAIINATKVDSLYAAGDREGAQKASDDALKFVKYGAIGGAVFITLYIIFIVVLGVGSSMM